MPLLQAAYPGIKPVGGRQTQGLDPRIAYRRVLEKRGFTQEWGLSSSLLIEGTTSRSALPKIASARPRRPPSSEWTKIRISCSPEPVATVGGFGAGWEGWETSTGRALGTIIEISSGVKSAASKRATMRSASGWGCLMKQFE